MNSLPAATLILCLEKSLPSQGVDYQKHIDDFGKVSACERVQALGSDPCNLNKDSRDRLEVADC